MNEAEADDFAVARLQGRNSPSEVQALGAQPVIGRAAIERLQRDLRRAPKPAPALGVHDVPGDAEQPGPSRKTLVVKRVRVLPRLFEYFARRVLRRRAVAQAR